MPTISEHDALPPGTRLAEFEVQQILGIGGFGVVYLAFDHALERQVAIKEYMPAALASRGFGAEVVVRSASHAETFTLGMRSFINEARLLARFDHPSLVKVYRFWEQHGTAYMVMPYYKGRTLQAVRQDMSRPPDEAWLRRLMMPLLGALECLHRENVFHRDVAPDNILLLDDESGAGRGQPVLLDLGAARRVIGGHTQTLTAIVKPSFAPIEQYAETVQLRQGPWTDLYALAAVVHFCITGRPPMPSTARTVHDDVATLRQMCASLASGFDCHFSESFAHAIDHALAVRPQDRPESVAAWRAELDGIVVHPGRDVQPPLEPKSAEWLAQEMLLGPRGTDVDGQSLPAFAPQDVFMTTIPAAGRLIAPPAWPASPGPSAEIHPTIAVPPRPNGMQPAAASQSATAQSANAQSQATAPQAALHAAHTEVPFVQTFILPAARASRVADQPSAEPLSFAANNIPATVPIARPAARIVPVGEAQSRQPQDSRWSADAPSAHAAESDSARRDLDERDQPATVTMQYAEGAPTARTTPQQPRGQLPGGASNASSTPGVHGVPQAWATGGSPAWLRWTFAGMGLMLCTAIWWSQPRSKPMAIAEPDTLRLTPAGDLPPPGAGRHLEARGDADAETASAQRLNKEKLARAERPARQEGGARKGEATRVDATAPMNPRRACGDRMFISMAICMKRHCSQPEYSGHAECTRMRRQEAAQRDNYYP